MALKLPGRWLWDFWLAKEGETHHLFYLNSPNTFANESERHFRVSVGHAVSSDLKNWSVLPEALGPSADDPDAFDNYTTWTGSVVKHDGLWYLFYTGSKKQEQGLVQRIGLATSHDLTHWQKHSRDAVLEADPEWYELLDLTSWNDQAWRDPWVFRDDAGTFHALVTARAKGGPPDARGVIGHATSQNLTDWQVGPPITEPGDFGQLEVPQLVKLESRYVLLFSTGVGQVSSARRARGETPVTGTYYFTADGPLGPFHGPARVLYGDPGGSLYAGKMVQDPSGAWVFLAFRYNSAEGEFLGELSDPYPVRIYQDGGLEVEV